VRLSCARPRPGDEPISVLSTQYEYPAFESPSQGSARLFGGGRAGLVTVHAAGGVGLPLRAVQERRVPGTWAGRVVIAPDFDAPLPNGLVDELEGNA